MIKATQKYSISSILENEARVRVAVPKYRRECEWKRIPWEDLFDSILTNPVAYCLGSIICGVHLTLVIKLAAMSY